MSKKEEDDWSAFLNIIKEVDLPIEPLLNIKDNDYNLATPEQKRLILNQLDQHIIDALDK